MAVTALKTPYWAAVTRENQVAGCPPGPSSVGVTGVLVPQQCVLPFLKDFRGYTMARRKGELMLLMAAASKWPWKVSAVLMPVSYLVCHLLVIATASVAAPTTMDGLGPLVIKQGVHAFAAILQYVFPMIFLVAASTSFISRTRSITLFRQVQSNHSTDISTLSWRDFERLVGEGFRYRGFEVTERGGAGPDGGVDWHWRKAMSGFWCNASNGALSRSGCRWCENCMASWRPKKSPEAMW